MSTVYGWTGPGDDARWEAAERADYEADRRLQAEDRAALMALPEDRAAPRCATCGDFRIVPVHRPGFVGSSRPCPECAA